MGETESGSIAFKRTGEGENYGVACFVTPLSSVAKDTRAMPRDWLNAAGTDVEAAFVDYVRPLTGQLAGVGQLDLTPIQL
ncbi:MAG: hypothetical protein HRU15_14825 [Planctomycetes bacterium]|nr:hypothetical protein [Planctomycetota bacterium]